MVKRPTTTTNNKQINENEATGLNKKNGKAFLVPVQNLERWACPPEIKLWRKGPY